MDKLLKLYGNCMMTRGASRGVICDLQKNKYFFVPNSLIDLFDADHVLNTTAVIQTIDEEDHATFVEYVDYLVTEDLAFYCTKEEIAFFPKLSMEWDFPSEISNCIIDIDSQNNYFNVELLQQLDAVNCRYLQLRFFSPMAIEALAEIFDLIAPSEVKAIDVVLKYDPHNDYVSNICRLVEENGKIRCLTLYGAPASEVVKPENFGFGVILQATDDISSHLHCGIITPVYFSTNIETFTEAQKHNTCLNRKLGIDVNGKIKNCPSMERDFGSIHSTTLKEAVNVQGFKDMWYIDKGQVNVCKVCEFRNICTDCRAYVEDPGDMYSKPLKCGYDPHTCTWAEWSTQSGKQNAIKFYHMQNLVKGNDG